MSAAVPADQVVLGALLARHAASQPDRVFAHFPETNSAWSYAQAHAAARDAAAALQALGVQRGDCVLCLLPNGEEMLRSWFGASVFGAIHTPCNLAWRGRMLENALALSGAKLAITHVDLLPRLIEIETHGLRDIIVFGAVDASLAASAHARGLTLHSDERLRQPAGSASVATTLQAWDDALLLFTSGTTGASKAVSCSYAHIAAFLMPDCLPECFGADRRYMVVAPMFHAGGISGVYSQLLVGGTLVLPARFRSDTFWSDVRRYEVSSTTLLGVMASFLLAAPRSEADRQHAMQVASIAPLTQDALAFGERFGVRIWTSYGATEMGAVLSCQGDASRLGTAGKLRASYQARLVDDHDYDVADGATGELVIRADDPWILFSGYRGNAAATVAAHRNGWYHTGDLMRRDAQGYYYFKDRKKDSIRRRGENISSLEVEAEIARYPGIREVAAYAVAAAHAEDEVMISISLHDDSTLSWAALCEFLRVNMPHYMVPRYCRQLADLPKTETGKIRKELLREQGVTADTWDREAAGIVLKGERLAPAAA